MSPLSGFRCVSTLGCRIGGRQNKKVVVHRGAARQGGAVSPGCASQHMSDDFFYKNFLLLILIVKCPVKQHP